MWALQEPKDGPPDACAHTQKVTSKLKQSRVVERGSWATSGKVACRDGICSGLEGQVDLARVDPSRHRPMHEPRSLLERAG